MAAEDAKCCASRHGRPPSRLANRCGTLPSASLATCASVRCRGCEVLPNASCLSGSPFQTLRCHARAGHPAEVVKCVVSCHVHRAAHFRICHLCVVFKFFAASWATCPLYSTSDKYPDHRGSELRRDSHRGERSIAKIFRIARVSGLNISLQFAILGPHRL